MGHFRDVEVDILRRKKGISVLDCAEFLGISYSSFCQRIGGYCKWKEGEREKLIEYINKRAKNYESYLQQK